VYHSATRSGFITALLAVTCGVGLPAIAKKPADPAAEIRSILQPLATTSATYGVSIIDLSDGRIVFSHNADRPLIPASNQKLFVMAAALDMLGADYEFRTVIGMRGSDLVIVGGGDPGLGDPRLCKQYDMTLSDIFARWGDGLRNRGVTEVSGGLILDESIFDDMYTHSTWDPRDLQKWYAAPVAGLNIADNCIEITAWPAKRLGEPPLWSIEPEAPIVEIVNKAKTAAKGVPFIGRMGQSFLYRLSGKSGRRATLEPVAVPDATLTFGSALRTALAREGITIRGSTRKARVRRDDGSAPPDLILVGEHVTPLRDVLARVGKNSQNLFAECLAKRIGFEHQRRIGVDTPQGSWASGANAVRAFLRSAGIDTKGFEMADGSGLSRSNRATASQLTGLLAAMHTHTERDLFESSLAEPGEPGSLRKRMRDLSNRVRGKTGTLRGVRSFSGYVTAGDGRVFAVSTVFNDIRGKAAPIKGIQDQICGVLASLGSPSRK
jgi:serine-type D-Ala-D-Ala carboxypeptidase/endopeptidase (penicillin-binding protein 4)